MRFAAFCGTVLLVVVIALGVIEIAVRLLMPHTDRLADNFSSTYLLRTFDRIGVRNEIVFLGDSVLWGYGVDSKNTAIARLSDDGSPVENLAFQGGSPANTYALLRLLIGRGIRPRLVVFNVNVKEFNAEDSAYRRLYPPLERVAWPYLLPSDRAMLDAPPDTLDARIDARLGNYWTFYGMRSDIRALLFGDADAATALAHATERFSGEAAQEARTHVATPERFLGTYDLSPLRADNVAFTFLIRSADLLAQERIPAVAILTPANHRLLHDYIDVPEYQRNLATIRASLQRRDVRVLDYDGAFRAEDFLDNDHLTVAGNALLAERLERDLLH